LIAMNLSRSEPEPQANTVEPPVVKMEVTPPEPTPPTPVVVEPKPAIVDAKAVGEPTKSRFKTVPKVTKKPPIKKPEIKATKDLEVKDPRVVTPPTKPKCDPFATSHARPCP
ncbi:MAG: hypothetical protein H0T42_15645, partial [Deltaproteobacteria bacterium]|nr:hypothetical protein [Deltaproteobacteria bacterium]